MIDSMTNDPKDRHIVAAAVAGGAEVIVTDNLRDFPAEALIPFHVIAQSADEFLMRLFAAYPEEMKQIIIEQAADLHRPSQTPQDVLNKLALHAPTFAARLRERLGA